MTNLQDFDTERLIDQWLKQEQNGEQFPVDFDVAWQLAGYSRKDSAKRYLPKSSQGEFFHVSVENSSGKGRPKEIIKLSCDGLKHLCLMAETDQGRQIRQYFIESEKKWRMVQERHPDIASEIEVLTMRRDIAKQEAIAAKAQEKILQLRHYVATSLPEPVQQKIFGYQVIEKEVVRDRVLIGDELINDGDTINKTALCYRYGFVTRNGKPDYKKLNAHLESVRVPSEAWKMTTQIKENLELRRDYLSELDKQLMNNDRQLYLGE